MSKYETVLAIADSAGQDEVDEIVGRLTEILKKNDVTAEVVPWGQRNLAYPIKGSQRAHFVFLRYEGNTQAVAPLERQARLEDAVLRFQTYLDEGEIDEKAVHYRNYERLAQYITDRGKIRPARSTHFNAKEQRNLSKQIKRARMLGLLPFTTLRQQ